MRCCLVLCDADGGGGGEMMDGFSSSRPKTLTDIGLRCSNRSTSRNATGY